MELMDMKKSTKNTVLALEFNYVDVGELLGESATLRVEPTTLAEWVLFFHDDWV